MRQEYRVTQEAQMTAMDNGVPRSGSGTDGAKGGTSSKPADPKPHDVGTALRNAFKATVQEDVPAEMLDLLRKLG